MIFQNLPQIVLLYILLIGRYGLKNDIKCTWTDSPSFSEQYPPKCIVLEPILCLESKESPAPKSLKLSVFAAGRLPSEPAGSPPGHLVFLLYALSGGDSRVVRNVV